MLIQIIYFVIECITWNLVMTIKDINIQMEFILIILGCELAGAITSIVFETKAKSTIVLGNKIISSRNSNSNSSFFDSLVYILAFFTDNC